MLAERYSAHIHSPQIPDRKETHSLRTDYDRHNMYCMGTDFERSGALHSIIVEEIRIRTTTTHTYFAYQAGYD